MLAQRWGTSTSAMTLAVTPATLATLTTLASLATLAPLGYSS